MSSIKECPVVYHQQVAWGDMDVFGMSTMSCTTAISKAHGLII